MIEHLKSETFLYKPPFYGSRRRVKVRQITREQPNGRTVNDVSMVLDINSSSIINGNC